MEGDRQSAQQKEMSTRPKEPRSRRGSAQSSVQSGDAASSKMKRNSAKPEKCATSEVDKKSDGHSGGRRTPKKSSKEERSKNYDSEESNDVTVKSTRARKETPAKKEKETSPVSNNKNAQLPVNVTSLPNGYNSYRGTTAQKELCNKRNKSKAQGDETHDRVKDNSSVIKSQDNTQTLGNAKCKSTDEKCEIAQHQAKVASGKKTCDKRRKEEKTKSSSLDKGNAEPKGRDVKTSSRTPTRMKDIVLNLRLKMEDVSKAAEKVNKFVDTIVKSKEFQNDPLFKDIKKMSTGSYYEHVKISNPNEFDIMLEISIASYNTIHLTNFDKKGPFYTLAFKDRRPSAMGEYIEEGNISASKIMKTFRDLIKQIKAGMEDVILQRKDPGSPAVTISIKNKPQDISVDLVLALKISHRWPEETSDGMNIDNWLGMKVKQDYRRTNFYMVPKRAMIGKKTLNADTWRISFSNIEKDILTNHGNGKTCCETGGSKREMCCRKQCLKLLKHLLELLKENGKQKKMDQFCSYHAKTALLHICAQYPKDDDWKLEDLDSCFDRYISFFQDCLKNYKLKNFFLPSHNLFSNESVDTSNCDYLYREIEKQKTNNYPIFND